MAKDFKQGQPKQAPAHEREKKESGTPKTGFTEAPKGECSRGGPGPGIRGGGTRIH